MKKVDYYAIQQPWRMPKWLGATLGGVFGLIAIGSAWIVISLTRPPAPIAALAAAPAVAAPAPAPAVPTPAAPAPAAEPAVASAAHASRASHHHRARRHAHHAVARRGGMSSSHAHQILAKRENNRSARHDKDALDKLLGL